MAPLLLGFILGDMIERNFRRAMIASDGSLEASCGTPADTDYLDCGGAMLAVPLFGFIRSHRSDNWENLLM